MANATEKRMIDANELLLQNELAKNRSPVFRSYAKVLIDNAPTIDAVEVVRCKDCLYCKDNVCIRKVKHGGAHSVDRVHANFFCAAGKRRADHEAEP